jgi:hypothetical protein
LPAIAARPVEADVRFLFLARSEPERPAGASRPRVEGPDGKLVIGRPIGCVGLACGDVVGQNLWLLSGQRRERRGEDDRANQDAHDMVLNFFRR